MSKSKFCKILIATLSLCLILGAAIGVSAFAAEEDATEEYAIKYVSKNVEYGSKTYLYYAVAEDYIPEADRAEGKVWMNVYNADGSFAFKQMPEAELVYVDSLKANCYIFKTRGVPAKELNTIEMVQVVTESGAKSALESYSVEEYLYQKLYGEKFALKTEADGKDYARRTLYFDLLKYGAIAQELLAPDATDVIGDTSYLIASGTVATGKKFNPGEAVTLKYAGTDGGFIGFKFTKYDAFGEVVSSGVAADGSIFVIDGSIFAEPVIGEAVKHNYITYDENSVENPVSKGLLELSAASDTLTHTYENGKLTMGDYSGGAGAAFTFYPTTSKTSVEGTITSIVFETELALSRTNGSGVEIRLTPNGGSTGEHISFSFLSVGGSVTFTGDRHFYGSGSKDFKDNTQSIVLAKAGEAFKLRIEHWGVKGDKSSAETRFYVNDKLIYVSDGIGGYNYFGSLQYPGAEGIGKVTVYSNYGYQGTMTVDNSALTYSTAEYYECPELYNELPEGIIDFGQNLLPAAQVGTNIHSEILGNYGDAGKLGYAYLDDPITGNTYLAVSKLASGQVTISDGNKRDTNFLWSIKLASATDANANKVVIEFDYMIESKDFVKGEVQMGIYYGSGDGTKFYIPYISPGNNNTLTKDTWAHIRMEYYVAEKTDGKNSLGVVKIYVDGVDKSNWTAGTIKASGVTTDTVPDATNVLRFTSAFNNSAKGYFRYDNIRMYHVYDPSIVVVNK